MIDSIFAAADGPEVQAKRTGFLQWRLGHDHGLGSVDLAEMFGIPEADALDMLRGDQPVPEGIVAAGKAALNAWHRDGHIGDVRTYLHREAAALAGLPV